MFSPSNAYTVRIDIVALEFDGRPGRAEVPLLWRNNGASNYQDR
jgi:hypothetical protein